MISAPLGQDFKLSIIMSLYAGLDETSTHSTTAKVMKWWRHDRLSCILRALFDRLESKLQTCNVFVDLSYAIAKLKPEGGIVMLLCSWPGSVDGKCHLPEAR